MSYNVYEHSRYRGRPVTLFLFQEAQDEGLRSFAYTDAEKVITRDGIAFQPWTIAHSSISRSGTLDKADVTVTMALGTAMDDLFLAYPPSQVINLRIFRGHLGDPVNTDTFPAVWVGRTVGAERKGNELHLTGMPVSTSLKRPGLRRPYSIGCPHVLYGDQCRASKAAATTAHTVTFVSGTLVGITPALVNPTRYIGGMIEWADPDTGWKEIRTIANVAGDGTAIRFRGLGRGLVVGRAVSAIRGCNRTMAGCMQHNNILNFGGQPFIPLENPLSTKNQFY